MLTIVLCFLVVFVYILSSLCFLWSLSAILEPLLRKPELFGSWVQVELPKELTKASRSWQASRKVISMDSEVNATLSHLKSLSLDHPENSRLLSCVKGWAPVFSGTHLVHSPTLPGPSQFRPTFWPLEDGHQAGAGKEQLAAENLGPNWLVSEPPLVPDLGCKGNKRPSHCKLRTRLWGLLHLSPSACQPHKLSCYWSRHCLWIMYFNNSFTIPRILEKEQNLMCMLNVSW